MKKNEIQVGGKYIAKVSGRLVTVRVDAIREHDGGAWGYRGPRRATMSYDVTNLSTGRRVTFRSATKFQAEAVATLRERPRCCCGLDPAVYCEYHRIIRPAAHTQA